MANKQKAGNKSKLLAQVFAMTNNPVALNDVLEFEVGNLLYSLDQAGAKRKEPRTIALCSEFSRHEQLKYFPGFQKLLDKCQRHDIRMDISYGFYKSTPNDKTSHFSTIIHIDPSRQFGGVNEMPQTFSWPTYTAG